MRCFELEGDRVTKGIPIIPLPYPHIGLGAGGPGPYTRIGISTRLASSLQTALREDGWQCRYNQLDHGCLRKKFRVSCDQACNDRQMIRKTRVAEYTSLLECCVTVTARGDFLIVSPRGGDSRGLLHVKLDTGRRWNLSFFRILDNRPFVPRDYEIDKSVQGRDVSIPSGYLGKFCSPALLGESVKLLAVECRESDISSQQVSGSEYLIVMDPGTAFETVEADTMASAHMSAYYDRQDVHADFYA
jgi:hypothetical protein